MIMAGILFIKWILVLKINKFVNGLIVLSVLQHQPGGHKEKSAYKRQSALQF